MGDVADTMTRIEDWLLFAEPDSAEADVTVSTGAEAAGAIAVALADASEAAPSLYAPDGHAELAPLSVIPGDLGADLAAVHRALLALADTQPPSGTFRALDLLSRCAVRSRSEDGAVLAAAARPGPGSVRLGFEAYRAYERFARAVLVDPLDRFAALPPPAGERSVGASVDRSTTPEVGL
jgi:hypothetical protein